MLRRVSIVLMVLGLTGVLCSGAAAAKPTAKRCPKGQVRITAKAPCVKPKVKAGATVKISSTRSEARFAKVAGKRGVKAAAAVVKALRGADPKRARIAEIEDEDADGQWHPKDVDGHPGRSRLSEVINEGDTPNRTVTGDTEVTLSGDGGAQVTVATGARNKVWFTACPDANGIAKGKTEETHIERKTAKRGSDSAFTELRTTITTDITVQVDDDAEVAKVTYDGGMDFELRATGVSANRYIIRWANDAPGPDVADRPSLAQRIATDPDSALAGTYRGPHGAEMTADEAKVFLQARVMGQDIAEGLSMRDILLLMKYSWQSDGRCVKLTLDPHDVALAGGQTGTFTATAKLVKDGSPIGGKVDEIAGGGVADQPHTTMAPGQTLTVKFTMGDADRGTLLVEVTSKRGKGSDLVDIKRPQGWDISYEADGTYAQTRTEHSDTDTTNMSLHFRADYPGIFFDGGSYSPLGGVYTTGTMTTKGTIGTGSFSCTAKPGRAYATIQATPAGDGATTLTLIPFTAVVADPETVDCQREGYGGDYGIVTALENAAPFAAHITVTQDMLTQPEFSVPVTLGTGFPANCGQGPTVTCSESGTLTGTVHFKRR